MTKEITKAYILQQLQDKFKLRELIPEKFTFSEMVLPTYNIEPHLEFWTSKQSTANVTATGPYVLFTVPENQRWRIFRYDVIFLTLGAFTVAGVYTDRVNKDSAPSVVYLDLAAAKSASYHIETHNIVQLDGGDALCINVDGYTSTANVRLIIDYEMEEIR